MNKNLIKTLFLDVGGVLMSNGWDYKLREKIAQRFNIELDEMNVQHELFFDDYEKGNLTFDEYLTRVIFFKKRECTLNEIKTAIFDSVRPYKDMIGFIKEIKERHGIQIVIVSNEGRELALDRIRRFFLTTFVDFFIVSSFVHLRKPDPAIYHLALDLAQVSPNEVLYIDDRRQAVEAAEILGIHGICHENFLATQDALERYF